MSTMMRTAMTAEATGTAQSEPTMFQGFVEEIANGGAEWPGQNKRGPEQQDPRHIRPEICRSYTASPAPKTSAPPP